MLLYDFLDCWILKPEVAKPGQKVSLNCSVDAEMAPSNVTWVKKKGSNSVPVNLTRVEIKGISLTIKSVSASDDGWYKCDYVLGQSHRCSEINLHLQGHQGLILNRSLQLNHSLDFLMQSITSYCCPVSGRGFNLTILGYLAFPYSVMVGQFPGNDEF
uniref:Ig-like domain-containing protein n=1 Tax=Poecilia latipinna TaxID=48699 RepID=A0A3B3VCA3_9TELE